MQTVVDDFGVTRHARGRSFSRRTWYKIHLLEQKILLEGTQRLKTWKLVSSSSSVVMFPFLSSIAKLKFSFNLWLLLLLVPLLLGKTRWSRVGRAIVGPFRILTCRIRIPLMFEQPPHSSFLHSAQNFFQNLSCHLSHLVSSRNYIVINHILERIPIRTHECPSPKPLWLGNLDVAKGDVRDGDTFWRVAFFKKGPE